MTPADLPNFEAAWWPVHLETVAGSGEKLAVAVLVKDAKGATSIRQAIPPGALNSIFGPAGKGMQLIVGTTVLSLQEQLDKGISIEQLQMPFGNTGLAHPRDCIARDVNEVFEIAMRLSSAFTLSQFGAPRSDLVNQEVRVAFQEWADKIKAQVVQLEQHAKFSSAFNVSVPLVGRKKAHVGFVYGGYLAQFGVLRPGKSISADERALKLKLFDIQMLRRWRGLQFDRAELIVGCPELGDAFTTKQKDSLLQSWEFIRNEAKALNVASVRCSNAYDAAEHLERQTAVNA